MGICKGFNVNNPTIFHQLFTSSMATLAGSFLDSEEVAGSAITWSGNRSIRLVVLAGGATFGAGV